MGGNHRVTPLPFFLNKPSTNNEEIIDNFNTGFDDDDLEGLLDRMAGVISILLAEFGVLTQVKELYEDFFERKKCNKSKNQSRIYIIIEAFNQPTEEMKKHLQPLHIKATIKGKCVGKILVDGGAAINLLPLRTLEKLGKSKEELKDTNMVVTNYHDKANLGKGVILLNVKVGMVERSTLFVVIPSKSSYNLLLGRDWIYGVGAIPSIMH